MTAYATASDLQERYPDARLAEVSNAAGTSITTAKLTTACQDATAEIDSYLGRRYTLPLPTVPAVLERVCCDIAIYRLFALLPRESVDDARKRYEDAIKWLEDVAAGEVDLGLTGLPPGVSTSTDTLVLSESVDRVFTQTTLSPFVYPWGAR
jgi:phage gp36-like protein